MTAVQTVGRKCELLEEIWIIAEVILQPMLLNLSVDECDRIEGSTNFSTDIYSQWRACLTHKQT